MIDNKAAQVVTGDRRAQATYTVDDLRQSEAARDQGGLDADGRCAAKRSTSRIRFDNIGTQVLGNIVLSGQS